MTEQVRQLPGRRNHLGRAWRFATVGASGVVVNTAVLTVLAEIVGLHPVAAAAIATEVAIISNFTLNDRWTFADVAARRRWLQRALRYNAVAMGGLLISVAVMAFLHGIIGLHYLVANLIAIGSATGWNYLANAWLTWTTLVLRPGRVTGGMVRLPRRVAYAAVALLGELWT